MFLCKHSSVICHGLRSLTVGFLGRFSSTIFSIAKFPDFFRDILLFTICRNIHLTDFFYIVVLHIDDL